jgi:hypothetical protein
MRSLLIIAGTFLVFWLAGCASGVEQTQISTIKEKSKRTEIEAILGPPIESYIVEGTTFQIYEYDRPRGSMRAGPYPYNVDPMANMGIAIIVGLVELAKMAERETEAPEKGYLGIAYSADEEVEVYEGSFDKSQLVWAINMSMALRKLAYEGDVEAMDVEAMYEYGYKLNDLERAWRWICPAAHGGHARAQYSIANYYRWGDSPVRENIIKSYLWRTLSLNGGHPSWAYDRDQTAQKMTADQITEAESLLAKWKPNPAECEREAKLAAD